MIIKVLLTYLCLSLLVTCALGKWRLVWSDEFDKIDHTKWNIRNMLGNIGNGEKQWYSPDSLSIFNNTLRISATKENYGGQAYKSGRLDTQDKAYFTYGRYESRARFSGGKGMWPAIWLLSQDKCWAVGSEVDIAEYRAVKSTELGVYYHYSNRCCYKFENCINTRGGLAKNFPDLSQDFHIYSFEWWPTNMTWFVDGWKIFEIQIPRQLSYPDLSPHYWILNSAIGGHYAEDPDQNTVFPNYFDIDYVRNYVWKPACEINDCSGRGCCDPVTVTCKCDPGWAGYNCEYDLRTYENNFYDITNNDNRPHGWGNKDTTYLDKNTVRLSNGGLKMTLTNSGCAIGNCGGTKYSSGGWESNQRFSYGSFSVTGRASNIPGTAFNIGIAGAMIETGTLEQISFTILGNETNKVRLYSYSSDFTFLHRTIDVTANLASNYYTYRIDYFPSHVVYYINNVLLLNTTEVMPKASRLGLGVYYTANTDWYGRFSYSSPSSVYISKASWTIMNSPKATCS